jgi:hypothetical protein
MIVFINTTGEDKGWQANAVSNTFAVAVYLTKEDKEKIAKMGDDAKVLVESRPGPTPEQRATSAAKLRTFGDKFYREAFARMLGLRGDN